MKDRVVDRKSDHRSCRLLDLGEPTIYANTPKRRWTKVCCVTWWWLVPLRAPRTYTATFGSLAMHFAVGRFLRPSRSCFCQRINIHCLCTRVHGTSSGHISSAMAKLDHKAKKEVVDRTASMVRRAAFFWLELVRLTWLWHWLGLKQQLLTSGGWNGTGEDGPESDFHGINGFKQVIRSSIAIQQLQTLPRIVTRGYIEHFSDDIGIRT